MRFKLTMAATHGVPAAFSVLIPLVSVLCIEFDTIKGGLEFELLKFDDIRNDDLDFTPVWT